MSITLRTVVTFFDPHPGLAGCLVPIPDVVKRAANELNGLSLPLAEAIERIQRVAGSGVDVALNEGHIGLSLPGILDGHACMHSWRVIRFRKALRPSSQPSQ